MERLEEAEGIINAVRDFLVMERAVGAIRREPRFLSIRAAALEYISGMIEQFDARGKLPASVFDTRGAGESWKVTRGTD